jgi:hypothetical protein
MSGQRRVEESLRPVAVGLQPPVGQRHRAHIRQAVVGRLAIARVPLVRGVVLAAADLAPCDEVRRDPDRLDVVGPDAGVVQPDELSDRPL